MAMVRLAYNWTPTAWSEGWKLFGTVQHSLDDQVNSINDVIMMMLITVKPRSILISFGTGTL